MKSYREIADSVFARREQYVVQQRKKKQAVTRIATSVGSVALVSLVGFSLLKSDIFRDTPPITDGVTATTTVPLPATDSTAATPTTSASALSQTDDTTVGATDAGETQQTTATPSKNQSPATTTASNKTASPATTTVPKKTESPATTTTAPKKTESPATTTTAPERILVTATEPDNFMVQDEVLYRNRVYIYRSLRKKMEEYNGVNAAFLVIVELDLTMEDYDEFPPTEELLQLQEEEAIAYQEFITAEEQAGGLYSPEVSEKRDKYRELASKVHALERELRDEYYEAVLRKRVDELARWSNSELVSLATETQYYPVFAHRYDRNYAFLMELTADEINELAGRGGHHIIRLAYPGEVELATNDGWV